MNLENLEMNASFKHEDLVRELLIELDKNLDYGLDRKQCCIYRVPEQIRRVNKKAYTPQLVSIGPLHHGKQELVNMEKTKRRYTKSFFQRIRIEQTDEILSFIKENEKNIRNCYAETSELGSPEYIIMILIDAIFIIELFLRNHRGDTSDLFLYMSTLTCTLGLDLQLLENQLPFFVLEEIFRLAFDGFCMSPFMELSQHFFVNVDPSWNSSLITPQLSIKHFTDWKRYILLESYPKSGQAYGCIKDLPCAMKLHELGVKFKKIGGEERLIRFEKQKHIIPFFGVHELQLPCLLVEDGTECLFRNIMALEQCHYPCNTHVCNYVKLMNFLIHTEKDVDLLVEKGIISSYAGDNATTANMFNKLCRGTTLSPTSYYNMCKELKCHQNSVANLRRVYFRNWWRGSGTLAAAVLLLLTIIQTICSILQVV